MSGPTTAAGRALLSLEVYNSRSFALITLEGVAAIEAEAAAAAIAGCEVHPIKRDEIRASEAVAVREAATAARAALLDELAAAMKGLPAYDRGDELVLKRDAVLAEIRRRRRTS